ncbi:MAG: kelch repeat-containing protein [Solirubrobacteraceae bacterium]
MRRLGGAGGLVVAVLLVAWLALSGGGGGKSSSRKGASTAHSTRTTTRTVTTLAYTPLGQLPTPVQDAAAAALPDGRLVLLGGLDKTDRSTASIVLAGALHGRLPAAQHDAAAATLGGAVYVFGGGDLASYDHILKWDPATGKVSAAGRLPRAASDDAVATIAGTAYIVGGYDGHVASADIISFQPGRAARVVGRLPSPTRYAAVAAVGGKLVIAGGTTGVAASDAVYVFDPATGKTRKIGRLPAPRTHAAAATLGGLAYVIGGRGAATGSATSSLVSIDPSTGAVHNAGRLPRPLSDLAALTVGSKILLAGGHDTSGTRAETGSLSLVAKTVHVAAAAAPGTAASPLPGDLLIADRGNNRLLLVNNAKQLVWKFPTAADLAAGRHLKFNDDSFVAAGGKAIVANEEESHVIVSVDIASHTITNLYGHFNQKGGALGYLNTPDDAYPLADGSVVVADAYNCRILFIKARKVIRRYGRAGHCTHHPPQSFGAVNGDTPVAGGGLLVSEIPGAWVDAIGPTGKLLYSFHPPVSYPSDPQPLSGGRILLADYASPGAVLIVNQRGRVLWRYKPTSGSAMLDHPSLALMLPNGNIAVNDDFRHRVVIIDPRRHRIVWQYGRTDKMSSRGGSLNTPDGMDYVPQDARGLPNWAAVHHP